MKVSSPHGNYSLYRRRWYILVVYGLAVICQNAFWNTFGAIEPYAITHYQTSKGMINFLSSLGPIVFIPFSFISVWFVDRYGLRNSVLATTILCGSGALIRCLYFTDFKYNIIFPIIGQTLNNAAGPFSMILQPKISSIWFAPSERTLATAIGFQANVIGLSACYFASMIVTSSHQVPYLLFGYATVGVFVLLLSLIYFPDKPPSPPSYTGELSGNSENHSAATVVRNSLRCFSSFSSFILIIFGSCPGGVYSAWGAMLVEIVTPLGYSENEAEWFGFWAMIAGGLGGVLFGKLHDLYKHYKFWLILLFVVNLCVFVLFTLLTSHVLHGSYAVTMLTNILGGLFMGAPSGILYEGIVESTYPVPEQTGVNVFSILFNLWSLFFLAAGDWITPTVMNWMMCASVAATVLSLFTIKENYLRSEVDNKNAYEIIQ